MTVEYSEATEVELLARESIEQHHPDLRAEQHRIVYVFRSEAAVSNGKEVWGKARKVTGLNAFLARGGQPFFVIEIAADIWKHLEPSQQRALVDHELSHCYVTDTGDLTLLPHDIEEFGGIVHRHGLWHQDVQSFAKVVQLHLEVGDA